MTVESGIDFESCRARTGPMTWGQQWIWEEVVQFGAHHNELNFAVWGDADTSPDIDHVLASIKELVDRHEILRTNFRTSDSGVAYQHVPHSGRFTVHLVAEDETNTANLVARITREPFSFEHDVPVRFVVVLRDGSPVKVASIFSHVAADLWSALAMVRELEDLMDPSSRAWLDDEKTVQSQAIDQALWEAGAHGLRRSERSLAFAARQLDHFPDAMIGTIPGRREDPPVQDITMRSRALDGALRKMSARYEVSASDALLVSVCAGLAELSHHDTCGLSLYASNRHGSMRNPALGTVVQDIPIAVPVRDPLPEAVKKAAAVARAAYFHGRYAPRAMRDLTRSTDMSCALNMQLSSTPDPDISPNDLKALRDETSIRRTKGQARDRTGRRFYLVCSTFGDEVELILKVNTEAIPVAAAESFLLELEDRSIHCSRG